MRGLADWPAGTATAFYPLICSLAAGQPHLSLLGVQDRAQAAVIVASGLEDLESSSGTFARLFISVNRFRERAQRQIRDACHAQWFLIQSLQPEGAMHVSNHRNWICVFILNIQTGATCQLLISWSNPVTTDLPLASANIHKTGTITCSAQRTRRCQANSRGLVK